MSEPRRLLEDAEGLERALLESAELDTPSPDRRRRLVALAGASVVTAGAASAGAGIATWKVVVAVVLVGTGGVAAAHRAGRAPPAATAAPPASVAPAVVRPTAESRPTSVASTPASTSPPAVAPKVAAKSAPFAPGTSAPNVACSVGDEVTALDKVRAAVRTGQAVDALARLDRYAATCPAGVLTVEARVLRIEALAAKGDAGAADRLARAFLAEHPKSTYDGRVRRHVLAEAP